MALEEKTTPLIPDIVLSRFFVIRNEILTDYDFFDEHYSEYHNKGGFYDIPCPDADGYFFSFDIEEKVIKTFCVSHFK